MLNYLLHSLSFFPPLVQDLEQLAHLSVVLALSAFCGRSSTALLLMALPSLLSLSLRY